MSLLISKDTVRPKDVGSKAGKLFELLKVGFPVPAGFVLASEGVAVNELVEALKSVGGFPVAVRSSGTLEDLGDASFAGMYESYLNVQSMEELQRAISACFASTRSERVQQYLASHNKTITPETLAASMRVLVQRMVPAVKAGVLFTLDPVLGKEEEFYIEVCEGLGERLVSGHVTPSRYRWNWQTQEIASAEVNDEGTELSLGELQELTRLALEIQTHYGHPQDIEWGIDPSGKVWILQSRPITQVAWRRDVPELTNADFKDGGVSARVCPPMMYSVYEAALQNSMGRYFQQVRLVRSGDAYQWIFYHYGRAYWNAGAVKEGLARIPGFDEATFDRDLGIAKDYGAKGPLKVGVTPVTLMTALNALCGVLHEYSDCRRMIDQFVPWFEQKDAELKGRLPFLKELDEKSFWNFAQDVYDFQFRTESSYFRTIYNNSNTQSDFKKMMGGLEAADEIDVLKLLSGLDEMAHMDMQQDLLKLVPVARLHGTESKQWQRGVQEFLTHHYHHGDVELDLTVPRWGEVPERIAALVKDLMNTSEPKRAATTWRDEWEKLDGRFKRKLSWRLWKRASVWKQLNNTRDYLSRREHMRTLSTRAYYLLRLVLLEGERRLNLPTGEVHLLRIDEFLRQEVPAKMVLDARRAIVAGYRHFQAPNEFGGTLLGEENSTSVEGALQGIGCSSGEIEAIVRVITSIEEAHQLQEGEVLVTKFTDPGWTPIMSRASAVVTEVGGVLSHAAVIGREYGIPAVLNVKHATQLLKTGERIRINGRSGQIVKLEEHS